MEPKETLSAGEVERLKAHKGVLEKMVNANGTNLEELVLKEISPEDQQVNKDSLRAQIKRIEKQLEKAPQRVSDPVKRDKIEKRMKDLEKFFESNLETDRDLGAIKKDSVDYRVAAQKARERSKYEAAYREWKALARMLEPEDPYFSSLNRIRKSG